MRLKRVKIFGFKTFADKTEFELVGNMTAVVGSNGCGKSNLVDAILWGLGEGNARQLRAHSSQDVIFSGSSKRKPLGYSEVTLHFDNEDGSLPIDASEVVISRRLSRSGDSSYSINRHSCRLRDIFDLLADSGLGRAGYAIVGQKEIDQALAASPEERRAWVDEAAGVQRYRTRKIESLKRLAAAKDHLSRVEDILHELDSQREPLRQEAEVAMRYRSIQASLKDVESGLLIVEVARASREVAALEGQISDAMRLIQAENDKAEADESEARSLTERVRRLESELDRQRDVKQLCLTAIERAEASMRLAQQKLGTLNDLEQNLGEEAERAQVRIDEASREVEQFKADESAEADQLDSLQQQTAGAGQEARALRGTLSEVERELSDARRVHSLRMKREAEAAHNEEREKIARRELKGIEHSLPDLRQGVGDAEAAHAEAETALKAHDHSIEMARIKLSELEALEAKIAHDNRSSLSEKALLEGRIQGIEATIEAHEGLNQGSKAVLDLVAQGRLSASYTPVGEAIDVRKEYATAIETALGNASNDLIVDSDTDAKEAIRILKESRLGRATFQPIPLMRPNTLSADGERLLGRKGVIGQASALVGCEERIRPVIESLLGRVIVVADLDVAIEIAKNAGKSAGWNRLVTLGGEIVHSAGAVTGGQGSKQGYGLVQRKADLRQAKDRLAEIERTVAAFERDAGKRSDERANIRAEVGALEVDRKGILAAVKEAHDWLRNLQHEMASTERSKQKVLDELANLAAGLEDQVSLPDVDIAEVELRRDDLMREIASKTADFDGAQARLQEGRSRLDQARLRREMAQKRLTQAVETEELRERKLSNLGPERERTTAELAHQEQERSKATAGLTVANGQIEKLSGERGDMLAKADDLNESARAARLGAQNSSERCHQAELQRARLDARRAASLQRLIEEYSLNEEDALAQEAAIELPSDAATVVNRLRRELKSMGEVNLGAVEAFERLTSRSDELSGQREDILGGIEQVEAGITELDKLTRDQFLDTFTKVESAFSEIFVRLFGGGEGKISLSNPDNLLESGVEIDVMLPGKKRQRLELLSGGERSLCATSFLFALLKVKPSPLVVLDEVDAPLDGRNVERFIELMRDFMQVSQFILITHNPTTIEASPAWLGVTMQEPGVSMLVPMRLAPASDNLAVVEIEDAQPVIGTNWSPALN